MAPFANKVALVTEASRGIGHIISERPAVESASVAMHEWQGATAAQQVAKANCPSGGKTIALHADICQVAAVRDLVTQTVMRFGQLDILVNNAGGGVAVALPDITEDFFEEQFARNTKGILFAMQSAAPICVRRGIINIATTVST